MVSALQKKNKSMKCLLKETFLCRWQRGRDQKPITDRLTDMSKKGININNSLTLMQAIHKLDPRSETI